ncbi:MAG: hypothetical protein IPN67_13250 [Bacteroidales bacterium]|nr:hypothetical protein [Bacteroidales bacterium]MBK8883307.1 hypothetical protein [Bacteroidales bacterium]
MRKKVCFLLGLFTISIVSFGQMTDPLLRNCALNAGAKARYLKDFRIQLGKTTTQGELRYKANISLWKNTKYRFTLCNSDDSTGELILNLKDDSEKLVVSSYDPKTGRTYHSIDFLCNKSGIYQLNYDFLGGQPGSGVGVVSIIE